MDEVYKLAIEAKELAIQVRSELVMHSNVVDKSLDEIKSLLKWVGSTLILLIVSVLGWSLAQQYQANEAQKLALHDQIERLQDAAGKH